MELVIGDIIAVPERNMLLEITNLYDKGGVYARELTGIYYYSYFIDTRHIKAIKMTEIYNTEAGKTLLEAKYDSSM